MIQKKIKERKNKNKDLKDKLKQANKELKDYKSKYEAILSISDDYHNK